MVDQFAEFAREMPAWTHTAWSAFWAGKHHKKGNPISWRHFAWGMQHIARARAQEEYRTAVAVRAAQHAGKDDYTRYIGNLRIASGLNR